MKATLLLQARTNSSRLPGKVLLPIAGVPLVVLAARRAANSGHEVVVVTSQESSDDILCSVLDCWGIKYFRGELNDTLKRFVDALEGADNNQIVVRLTGDNVFPDGSFIDELLLDYQQREISYLTCVGEPCGLPYGVSAEVTKAKYLREAHKRAVMSFDREHVTSWIAKKYGRNFFTFYQSFGMHQWRCTVDTLSDYLLVAKVFGVDKAPEKIPLNKLLEKLKDFSVDIVTPVPATRLVLGTAQFGLKYGIANKEGQPEEATVERITRSAIANGVQFFDTARAYGGSERVLGNVLAEGWSSRVTIITKLSTLEDCPVEADYSIVKAFTERSIYQSCYELQSKKIDVLLLHRTDHLTAWLGAVWETVKQLKQCGVVGEIGVSVQTPEEVMLALKFEDVSFIQLPYNILDHRWGAIIKTINKVRQQRKLTIHTRSALLQGLLATTQCELWHRAHCSNIAEVVSWLKNKAQQYTNGDVIELCLRYVLSQSWIDGVVMGVDNQEQLLQNILKTGKENWPERILEKIADGLPLVSEKTLNPANWKHNNA
ncbi:aldo/keto reductase [Vreelandella titanicae]|uniref:aldo/keto reductase n=1 Tax=Vreelandella titanicae TaxID=664683 RepID=UPI003CFF23B0|tara:strand:- start:8842 stop:10473 length:1632 start_codon:yes stop_codon:yes gene_type:complete